MIQVIRSEDRFKAEHGWLTTWYSFSFAHYYDPHNVRFGPLRVFNEDMIQPGTGFDMHPHHDMEVMTYVIEGVLEHRDSLGNRGIIQAGEVQRMTAGTGVLHAEYNPSDRDPLHLLQIWFLPNRRGLTPSWEQKQFTKAEQRNRLLPVVTGDPSMEDALKIHQDVTVYLSDLEGGKEILHHTRHPRMYLFVIGGQVMLNGQHELKQGDTARITDVSELRLTTTSGGQFMLMDLA
ncbi:MAG: pirin family protein [Alicyclobacillaceae bacterium]|nr:pirin family protein [Alicyclobacillaceae bacterium]